MRILHILRAPVGGLFRHVLDLTTEQVRLGHDVGILVATTSDALTERRLGEAAPAAALGIHRIPMARGPGLSDILACRAVRGLAKAIDADVLHGHGAKGGTYARLAGAGGRASVVYTPHGGTLHYAPRSMTGRVYHGIERALDRLTDAIVFESAFAASAYASIIGPGRAPRRIVHNGMKPQDFTPVPPHADAADVLYIGEMRKLKGVDVLLQALAELKNSGGNCVRAVLVGDGPDRAAFEKLARDVGLAQAVRFPGAMPAAEAFRLGRIVVVPSLKESLPYVVLEAAAAGLPIVATSVGGIPEIVAGTDTPLVPPDDAAALGAAIGDTLADPAGSAARAVRLQANIAARFTVERMAVTILETYTHAAATRASAARATSGWSRPRLSKPSRHTSPRKHDA